MWLLIFNHQAYSLQYHMKCIRLFYFILFIFCGKNTYEEVCLLNKL